MPIRGRLLGSFGTLLLLVLLVGAVGWFSSHRLQQQAKGMYQDNVRGAVALGAAQSALWELRYGFPQFIALPEERQAILDAEPVLYQRIDEAVAAYAAGNITAEERAALDGWNMAFGRYRLARPTWFELYGAGKLEEAAQWRAQTTTPYGREAVAAMGRLIELQQTSAAARYQQVSGLETVVVSLVAASAVLGLVFAVVFSGRRQRKDQHAAHHDALTGLGNRMLLAERGGQALAGPSEDGSVALLLLDLQRFKEVNDTLGHHAGDELLVAVAARLREACRGRDTVVRLGGDEFAMLLTGLPAPDSAVTMANRLLDRLRQPVVIEGLAVDVDASVGVALAPEHGEDLPTLLRCADVAMYDAKRAGTGVAVYDVATDPREARQLNLLGELRQALADNQLRLHYQPKSSAGGQVNQVEALLRWQHPERGLLGPAHFLPLAERTSLIRALTEWVLGEAARQAAAWREQGHDLQIAVNVSPRNLLDDDLPGLVLQAATAAGISVSALQIEITETAVMADPARATDVLAQLRSMGVQVAIDDFGVGYTSLSYLGTLPVQIIKIDRRFVADLLDNSVDEAVVRNVIHLAHDLGMTTVAEGVESSEVWHRLNQLGCEQIQGYVLTKPLPADDLLQWITAWRRTHMPAFMAQ